jgi:ankyrin repeat protein
MAESNEAAALASSAPSDVLMALYMQDRDRAKSLATGKALSLPELAAFGNLQAVSNHVTQRPADLAAYSPDGWTSLHLSAFFGYALVVVRLLRAGASHSARSHNVQGNTALHAAIAGRCDMAVMTALLAAGSDAGAIDAQGYAPLHLAADRGDLALSELLLACGASNETRTTEGMLPADLATAKGHHDLAEWLARA